MKYTTLQYRYKVSKICLGTMTFGQQNTEAEGHAQMDYALENGVNFLILLRCILFQRIKTLRVQREL
jgi:hypothetical protein